MSHLTGSSAWQALQVHQNGARAWHLRELFNSDPNRASRFCLSACGVTLDFSKNLICDETLRLLLALARQAHLERWIERMFAGDKINHTEDRAVLHVALRNRSNQPIRVDGVDVMPEVNRVLAQMRTISDALRAGTWRGYTGKAITDVVNIGIGGSDLGPAMACAALRAFGHARLSMHFVSNVDGTHLAETLTSLDPGSTLFVVCSKTFTTQETLANARSARQWLLASANDERAVAQHFVAVSTNRSAVQAFGVHPDNMLEFWDWVGGRYSLWSAVGLAIALLVGMGEFEALLQGGHELDEHFRSAPLERNLPVVLALLGIWYRNFWQAHTHAVLPYSQSLARFPAYLQQLEMESNGKRVDRDGASVDYATAPVIWGEAGTNGQHAFYQLLHQGTALIPADFLAPIESAYQLEGHQDQLLANFLAQTEALARGKAQAEVRAELEHMSLQPATLEALLPHRVFPGNKPTNSILFRRLDARTLGALIALYEHKVFVQGIAWNINSFDQWGVELGKQLAGNILPELQSGAAVSEHDASTAQLIARIRAAR